MAERFDLDAIEADDALLDLLAAGGESAGQAGEHDPALKLLAELRLAVEVEDELPVESIDDAETFLARCAALNPVTDPLARKVAARGLAVGVAAVAALSVSGVAAAVSGDPLAPYEKVIEKVVDGLRPQTSFPKEQLDGMPVVDKTQIVRVAKDYQDKQKQQHEAEAREAEQQLTDPFPIGLPELDTLGPKPPLARTEPPQVEKPTTTRDPLVPAVKPTADQPIDDQPIDDKPADPPVDKPQDKPPVPGDDPTGEPVEPTPPPSEPSDPPATPPPATPPPVEPAPTDKPTDQPTNPGGGNGQNGEQNPTPTEPATPPPSQDTGQGGTGGQGNTDQGGTGQGHPGQDNPGQGDTGQTPGGDSTGGETQPGGAEETKPADEPTGGTTQPGGDRTGTPTDDQEQDDARQASPTPTEPPRLEQYVDKQLRTAAKHSNGKYSLGYAKQQYAKGKHSNGRYVEGRHAAFERAHGSMSPVTLRQILWVLNHPTGR